MPRVRGPADGKGVEAKFNTQKTGTIPENSSVLITVSVNNDYFCDQWFKAILKAVKEKFSKITILIVDAPNAYNLEADDEYSKKTPDDRHEQALQLGEIWWSKNKLSFQEIFSLIEGTTADEQIASFNLKQKTSQPNVDVIRWNEWIKEQDFNIGEIKAQFQTNAKLQSAVDSSAKNFADRVGLQLAHPRYSACIEGFKKYLIEESVGILLLMHKKKYDFVAYPDPMLEALKQTYSILVSPQGGKTADQIWLQIDFKRFKTEEQKTAALEKSLSKLKVKKTSPSSSNIDLEESSVITSSSMPLDMNRVSDQSNNNPSYSHPVIQDNVLRKELEEMKKTQEILLLRQIEMEKLLLQQAATLQKLTKAKMVTRYRSNSAPDNPQTGKTYFFKKGILRKDFLAELEKQKPILKTKHETLNLLISVETNKHKVQHSSFPSPNPPSL